MAGKIFEMIGLKNGKKKALDILESGMAYKKMLQIIKAQGGVLIDPDKLRVGKHYQSILASKKGIVTEIKNDIISKLARIAGAPQDKEAGMFIYKHVGDRVNKNDLLFIIYSNSHEKLKYCLDVMKHEHPFTIR